MIKNKLLLIAIIGTSILVPAVVRAQRLDIQVGDRPYYNHGARYWENDYEMVWAPGHMSHHRWVHGHYVRGEHRRHDGDRRHDDRNNDRHDDNRGDDHR
jgi:hypothetical protein